MSSTPNALDTSWKTALNSQPEGSFMFPENVVVEELLDHIDNTWDALWEGQPKGSQPNERSTLSKESSTEVQASEKRSLWSVVKRVLRFSKKSKKEVDTDVADGTQYWGSVIPRFPSGMDWYKGTN